MTTENQLTRFPFAHRSWNPHPVKLVLSYIQDSENVLACFEKGDMPADKFATNLWHEMIEDKELRPKNFRYGMCSFLKFRYDTQFFPQIIDKTEDDFIPRNDIVVMMVASEFAPQKIRAGLRDIAKRFSNTDPVKVLVVSPGFDDLNQRFRLQEEFLSGSDWKFAYLWVDGLLD